MDAQGPRFPFVAKTTPTTRQCPARRVSSERSGSLHEPGAQRARGVLKRVGEGSTRTTPGEGPTGVRPAGAASAPRGFRRPAGPAEAAAVGLRGQEGPAGPRAGEARPSPSRPRQPGAPLPPARPPPRQRGAGPRGPFGRFRRALGSFRVRGGAGRAGAGPVRARGAEARPAPRPRPGRPHRASVGGGGCRDWNPPAGARREEGGGRRRRAGRKARAPARPSARDDDCTAARGATGPGRCTPRAEAEPGPRAPRRLAARPRSAPRAGG